MTAPTWIGKLFAQDELQSVERVDVSLAAPWAHQHPGWVVAACAALALLSGWFYFRRQSGRHRLPLAIMRAVLLCLVLLLLAEPTLVLKATSSPKPLLWLLFDGTESMLIEDDNGASPVAASRTDQVKELLAQPQENLVARLSEKFRLKAFLFDRPDGVRALEIDDAPSSGSSHGALGQQLSTQLTAEGPVTALGSALGDLSRRHAGSRVAGVLVFSDFDQNSGTAPLASASGLGAPIFTVGVGPESAQDISIDLGVSPLLKKAERSVIVATLRQTGLEGRSATVRLYARKLSDVGVAADKQLALQEKTVTLDGPAVPVEFLHTPDEPGQFVLTAEVEPLAGEIVEQNNRTEREVSVRDDFLRLMYVEYEPTWEWRFIKEVFHRDKLVGTRGFRTYLRSADPKVRQTNELFLETLAPPRSEFFTHDVIFLGDMPASALSTRFCDMTREFVSTFGGGLVILSGSRFGPGELAETPLADMLPVVVDREARLRDDSEFAVRLAPDAALVDFMRLGLDEAENAKAWNNLGHVPWYQPSARLHPLATALAVHPADTCVDGRTPQPLIAVRRYGRGEVVYLAFNETWRLRRLYGELYYRQFWGQMIHRLGLSHAPGAQKRFVVRTDRPQYQADDQAVLTVEAYDVNFEPLSEDKLPDRKLVGELFLPPRAGETQPRVQPLTVPQTREGLFEAHLPLLSPGEYLARVQDPITNEQHEVRFQAANISIERRSAVRNVALERELALATGGKNYNLQTVSRFVDEFNPSRRSETRIDVSPIAFHRWLIWPCFLLLVLLMLGEWLGRKWVNLP
ncbi:MAG: hypothetical protein AB7O62_00805 [Pirellulales bacterium]